MTDTHHERDPYQLSDGASAIRVYAEPAIYPGCCLWYSSTAQLLYAGPISDQPGNFPNNAVWMLNPRDYDRFRKHYQKHADVVQASVSTDTLQ